MSIPGCSASGRGLWTAGESISIWNWPARTTPTPASARGMAGISLPYHLPGGQLGEPERLRERSREAQRCVRGQQSAAQSHVWMERDLHPSERVSLEVGYDYSDDFSQILVCFVSSTAPAGIAKCPGSTVLSEDLSIYTNKSHYGYFDVMWKPVRRLTTHLGYNITSTTGSALFLTPTHRPDRSTRTTTGRMAASTTPLRKGGRARPIGATTAITKIRVQLHKTCLPPETSAAT